MGKCKCQNCGVMFTDDDYEPGDEIMPLVCDDCYMMFEYLDELENLYEQRATAH